MASKFSTFLTLQVPATGPNVDPAIIARANIKTWVRVELKNVGATLIFVGSAPQDVAGSDGPVTAVYRIPPGDIEIFVLAPEQPLYAVAAGVGALISVAMSEAYPGISFTPSLT